MELRGNIEMNKEKEPEKKLSGSAEAEKNKTVKSEKQTEKSAETAKEETKKKAENPAEPADATENQAVKAEGKPEKQTEKSAETAKEETKKETGNPAESADTTENKAKKAAEKPEKKKPSFLKSEKFRHGSTATAFTAGFIAVVILINVIAGILGDRFPSLNLDITKNNTNTLSADALKMVDKVKIPISITICASKTACENGTISNGDYSQVSRLFSKAAERNTNLKLDYLDLDKNPAFVQKYKSDNLTAGDIVIQSDKRYRVLTSSDLFTAQSDSTGSSYNYYSEVDSALTSALNAVTSDTMPVAAFETGHNEKMDDSGYKKLLGNNSFETKEFSLLTDAIPDKTQLLILGCPATDYTDEEIEKLDKYLNDTSTATDRTLLIAYSAGQGGLTKLDAYLAEWGLSASGDTAVAETNQSNYFQSPLNLFANARSNISLGGSSSTYSKLLTPYVCPVTIKAKSIGSKSVNALVQSSDTSTLVKTSGSTATESNATHTLAAISQELLKSGDKPFHANLILSGSTMMFSSDVLRASAFSNSSYVLDLSKYATGTSASSSNVVTTNHELYAKDISVNETGIRWLGFGVFTLLIPLAVAVAGIIVYRRRRTL